MASRSLMSCESLESRQLLAITFAPAVQNPLGATTALASADFTGDHRADLVAKGPDGTVRFYRGNGNGTFVPSTNSSVIPAGANVTSLTAADIDRDGKMDLVATNGQATQPVLQNLRVLRGNGNGGFTLAANVFAGNEPVATAVTDFNRDGKLDIAVANLGQWSTSAADAPSYGAGLLIGNGDGTWQSVKRIKLLGPQNVVAAPPTVNATVASTGFGLAFGGQSVVDAGPLPRAAIYTISMTNSEIQSSMFLPFVGRINGLAVARLNSDDRFDLAALQLFPANTTLGGDSTVHAFVQNNDGFAPAGAVNAMINNGVGLSLADFDRDGRIDAAVAGERILQDPASTQMGLLSTLKGNGTGQFATPMQFPAGPTPTAQTTCDLNGDARLDIVIANITGVASMRNVPILSQPTDVNNVFSLVQLVGL